MISGGNCLGNIILERTIQMMRMKIYGGFGVYVVLCVLAFGIPMVVKADTQECRLYAELSQNNILLTTECDTADSTSANANNTADLNTIGFGISGAEGDATLFQMGMLYSISYARAFAESPFALEVALHATGNEKISAGGARSYLSVATGIIADATFWCSMPPNNRQNLRIGVGTSVRHYGYLSSTFRPPAIDVELTQTIEQAIGLHSKAEYVIPLDVTVEIAIRAQAHFFFRPFTRETTLPPDIVSLIDFLPSRSLSLGAFFRIKF
jgi:hypothetical protein